MNSNVRFLLKTLKEALTLTRVLVELVLQFFRGLLPLVVAYCTKIIIDRASETGIDGGLRVFYKLLLIIFVIIIISLVEGALEIIDKRMRETDVYRISQIIQFHLIEKFRNMDQRHLDDSETYDILSRGTQLTENSIYSLYINILLTVASVFSSMVYLSVLFKFNIWISLLAAVLSIVYFFINKSNMARNEQVNKELTRDERLKDYFSSLLREPKYAKETRVFQTRQTFLQKYTETRQKIFKLKRVVYRRNNLKSSALDLSVHAVEGFVFFYIVCSALRGAITIGDISLLTLSFNETHRSFNLLLYQVNEFLKGAIKADYYQQLINIKNNILHDESVNLPEPDISKGCRIQFVNVSFHYPGRKELILKNINLIIELPETIAIVGLNGAGKSTLIKLLLRIYDPTEGYILLNGKKLSEYNAAAYYKLWGVLFQKYNIFSMTLAENITFSDEDYDSVQMENALRTSQVSAFINKLDGNMHTEISRSFSSTGFVPSGGETQRIAFARSVYKNASLLIFDEPSASIDVEAEYEIFKNVMEQKENKLIFIISHRLSNVVDCDKIIFLKNGEIVEIGRHDELVQNETHYRSLFHEQSKWYGEVK